MVPSLQNMEGDPHARLPFWILRTHCTDYPFLRPMLYANPSRGAIPSADVEDRKRALPCHERA